MSSIEALVARARAWITADPDPVTREAAEALITARDAPGLEACFGARLEFGTAGLRGRLGPGPGCMNRALVRQVAAGLGHYLLENTPDATERGVIIGRDGRHGSLEFAEDTAAVLAGLGIPVYVYEHVVATPTLSHGVVFVGAAAGVMVTASHNPPEDNGYKVYWRDGAQIIPPHDACISAAIEAVGSPANVNVPQLDDLRAAGLIREVPAAAWEDYVRQVLACRVHPEAGAVAVYTAMHGVGWAPLQRLVAAAGHLPLVPVPEQVEPDGDFPTVRFPNPEEPGALDLALAKAVEVGADIVLANDPDADRLAVAIPDEKGGYRALTGNQIGLILADDLLRHGPQVPNRMVATSIVSSSLLKRIAQVQGAKYVETLTGFKWIANAAIHHDGPFVMGFEEALGYTVGPTVRDKDGLSAALIFLDLASWCKRRGVSLASHVDELYRRYGYVGSLARSLTLPGLDGSAQISAMMAGIRAKPPRVLGGVAVSTLRDVSKGTATDLATGVVSALDLPASNVLAFDLADGGRVLVRPSGTEPKIKFYVEIAEAIAPDEPLSAGEARALARARSLADEVVALAHGAVAAA